MHVAHSADELRVEGPCLVDRYLEGALELDVDALCDGESALGRGGARARRADRRPLGRLGLRAARAVGLRGARGRDPRGRERGSPRGLGARGLINLQLALTGGKLCVLEANPRASRTVPFVAKATGVPLVEHAVRLLLGEPLSALGLPERAVPIARLGEGGRVPGRALPRRRDARPRDALDRRGDGRRRDRRPRRTPARCAPPGASRRGGKIGPPLQASALS